MYDMSVNVAYIPKDRVIGLSKIARICDMAAKRLQLQEKLGSDIAEIMTEATGSPDVGVVIAGTHSCLTARGIKNASARTITQTFCGAFRTNADLQKMLTEGVK
jgi:GTP cyclohydrolase I